MAMTSNYYWQEQEHKAPCNCDCPNCEEWRDAEGTLNLTEASEGFCYTGEGVTVIMPDISTVAAGWCFSFKNGVVTPSMFYTYESYDGGGVYFVIDGVDFTWMISRAPAGEICICYLDATHWLVTGSATGVGRQE
jgi:hypothetical protein